DQGKNEGREAAMDCPVSVGKHGRLPIRGVVAGHTRCRAGRSGCAGRNGSTARPSPTQEAQNGREFGHRTSCPTGRTGVGARISVRGRTRPRSPTLAWASANLFSDKDLGGEKRAECAIIQASKVSYRPSSDRTAPAGTVPVEESPMPDRDTPSQEA